MVHQWKRALLEGASGFFERGGWKAPLPESVRHHGPAHAQGAGLADLNHIGSRVLRRCAENAIHKFGPTEIIIRTKAASSFHSHGPTACADRISMDRWGRFFDNFFIEWLWRTLKYECVYLHAWRTGSEAKAGVRTWMTFYNHKRPHSALGGKPPAVVCWQTSETTNPDQQVQRDA